MELDAALTRLRGIEDAAPGIVATGVESIFNEPPLSQWRTPRFNLYFRCIAVPTLVFTILNTKSSVWYRLPVSCEPAILDNK
jgi:hypothetical protein